MSAIGLHDQEWTKINFDDFIVPKYTNALNTTIQNRAQVFDVGNMMQGLMGVERVPFRGMNLLQKEFGASGELVWELESKDSRVRFVGGSWIYLNNNHGGYASTGSTTDYLEIIFYGTAFNIILGPCAASGDFRYTLDNAAESANILPATLNNTFNSRNYPPTTVFNIVSGLSLGFHSIKIRAGSTANMSLNVDGFEVINEATLRVTSGQAFIGNKKEALAVLSTSAYNAGFSGTKGGRSIKYSKDNVVSQTVRECPSTPSYLTSTDHTNEEVVKRLSFREFGANRADDFSTLGGTSSSRAFTLDDGTTGLVGTNVAAGTAGGNEIFSASGFSNFFAITFVGTGLDMIRNDGGSGATNPSNPLIIDGVTVGNVNLTRIATTYVERICSGLPYGTHTVKVLNAASGSTFWAQYSEFIIYQPKAPALPVGASQILDFNVPADYIASTSAAPYFIGQGLIRKALSQRECLLTGTWTSPGLDPSNFETGFNISSSATGSTATYRFFGTGFEWRGFATTTTATSQTISVDGSSNLSGFTNSFLQVSSGITFTASTGTIAGTSAGNGKIRVQVSGLALGYHTVTVTSNNVNSNYVEVFDYITPIHINHPTLKIGSLSLINNAKIGAIRSSVNSLPDLSKAKAWVIYDPNTARILSSYNVAQVLAGVTGAFVVYFSKPFKSKNYGMSSATRATGSGSNRYMTQGDTSDIGTSYCKVFQAACTSNAAISDTVFYVEFTGELAEE